MYEHLMRYWLAFWDVFPPVVYAFTGALPFWIYLFFYLPLTKVFDIKLNTTKVTSFVEKSSVIFFFIWFSTIPLHSFYYKEFDKKVIEPYKDSIIQQIINHKNK